MTARDCLRLVHTATQRLPRPTATFALPAEKSSLEKLRSRRHPLTLNKKQQRRNHELKSLFTRLTTSIKPIGSGEERGEDDEQIYKDRRNSYHSVSEYSAHGRAVWAYP